MHPHSSDSTQGVDVTKYLNYRYIFNATAFNALQSVVIEKEEISVSPLVIKRRIDQAFQNAEEILTKHADAFAKVLCVFKARVQAAYVYSCYDLLHNRKPPMLLWLM